MRRIRNNISGSRIFTTFHIPEWDVETYGLPLFDVLGLQLLQRGGSSPLSNPSFAHWMQASTPRDLLAKTRFSIIRSIQSINSWSMMTP
jgi:hypothetical protein